MENKTYDKATFEAIVKNLQLMQIANIGKVEISISTSFSLKEPVVFAHAYSPTSKGESISIYATDAIYESIKKVIGFAAKVRAMTGDEAD